MDGMRLVGLLGELINYLGVFKDSGFITID